jgi:pimeloyl-ACP methyl ester carboxylesterase
VNLERVSPVSDIGRATTPILLIHGLNDSRTPFSDSQKLARANPRDALWLVPNAEHTGALVAAPEEFSRRVQAWFGGH